MHEGSPSLDFTTSLLRLADYMNNGYFGPFLLIPMDLPFPAIRSGPRRPNAYVASLTFPLTTGAGCPLLPST